MTEVDLNICRASLLVFVVVTIIVIYHHLCSKVRQICDCDDRHDALHKNHNEDDLPMIHALSDVGVI